MIRRKSEIDKQRVIGILRPRCRNRYKVDDEEAERLAEKFLDDQELKSGLLVSRQSKSYRFVHLTFGEYLAAWHLARCDQNETEGVIREHLRAPEWFERWGGYCGYFGRDKGEL